MRNEEMSTTHGDSQSDMHMASQRGIMVRKASNSTIKTLNVADFQQNVNNATMHSQEPSLGEMLRNRRESQAENQS